MGVTVLKISGELLEPASRITDLAAAITAARRHTPRLAIVHGGGRAIDRMLDRVGLTAQAVNGLRITDDDTLDIVVSVLAGLINTRLVAALNAAGTPAVGLTGADAQLLPVVAAPPVSTPDNRVVSLGRVGEPANVEAADADLAIHLIETGYVPVIASVAADDSGALLNVNADTFAAALAAAIGADRLVIAGSTAGVLSRDGATIPTISIAAAEAMIAERSATAGMIAKLRACADAVARGIAVAIVDGDSVADALAGRPLSTATVVEGIGWRRTPVGIERSATL